MKLISVLTAFSLCLVTNVAFADSDCEAPASFFKKFMQLEMGGARLKASPTMDKLISGNEQPGWDTAQVVSDYTITKCEMVGTEAVFSVRYDVIGTISSFTYAGQPDFSKERRSETLKFHVMKTKGGYKLQDLSEMKPHISVTAAVENFNDLARENASDPSYMRGVNHAIDSLQKASRGGDRLPASANDF